MSKISWMSLLNFPAIVGATLLLASSAMATKSTVTPAATTTATIEEMPGEVADIPTPEKSPASDLLTQAVDTTETSIPSSESTNLDGSEVTPESDYLEQITNVSEFDDLESVLNESNELETETNSLGQVTSVTELIDVSPGDWAYDAPVERRK
ncbi:MAG: hypothetical protein F6K41_15710, partial [Symploca sp. SIO3E6]|nr:hypothetical protein [Caldora sp. SIO3E6]